MNTTTTKIAGEAMTDQDRFYEFVTELAEPFWLKDAQKDGEFFDANGFARALLASKPAAIGALERSEIFRSNLQRTREQWEKCDPDAMSKMSQAAVFHAINDAKRDVLMMHALLTTPTAPAQSCGDAEQADEAVTISEQVVFAWLVGTYVQRADDRQKSMGLQYTEAETHDLAKEIVKFIGRTKDSK
jgi:hypothetical protein